MTDNDMIRRGDARAAIQLGDTVTKMQARIASIPAVDADPVCTDCGGSGITYQTERRCACQTSIPAVQPTVKPLVWLDSQQGRYSESRAIGILYSIRLGSDGVTRWQAGHMGPWHEVASIEAAKAAAQADYEARILSALDTQPTVSPKQLAAQPDDVAALLDAAEKVISSYWYASDGVITGIYDLETALARVKGENK